MKWTRGPAIGRGSTATVSLALTTTGERYAVKTAELSSSIFLQKEQAFLSKLDNPHIIKYIGSDTTHENNKSMFNLLMEYIPGGTISEKIKIGGGKLDESLIRSYTWQILNGLEYLHANGIAHCDLKSQNVLLHEDRAVITDLGCSKLVSAGTSAISGTPAFMSPEVARGEEQGFAADVWAVGCTVIEMATGSRPWPELENPVSAIYKIGYSGESPAIPDWLSEKGKNFLNKCLKRDPKERWAVKELLEHPFFDEKNLNSHNSKESDTDLDLDLVSPNTVLDQAFWNSSVSPVDPVSLTDHKSCFSNSPAERIKSLMGTEISFSSWINDDEDWITVREINREETNLISVKEEPVSTPSFFSDNGDLEEVRSVDFGLFSDSCVESTCNLDVRRKRSVSEMSDFQTQSKKTCYVLC